MSKIVIGDALVRLKEMKSGIFNMCVTSPPYWGLRDYGEKDQIGLEDSPDQYVKKLVDIFREVRRVLRDDGTLWLNLGDSYCGTGDKGENRDKKYPEGRNGQKVAVNNSIEGLKRKDLVGIPWRVAFALQEDGWYLRQDIIWQKTNPMPESVKDRCTRAHEYIFLLSKKGKYYFDSNAIKEKAKYAFDDRGARSDSRRGTGYNSMNGKTGLFRNKRSVWTVSTQPFKGEHFAAFPQKLIEPCIFAGCPEGGLILDPFFGAGTTGLVAKKNNRDFVGIELNKKYVQIAKERIEAIDSGGQR